jgi:hypothetical protein
MKNCIIVVLMLFNVLARAQTIWTTEAQTSFVDITGLFGLNEVAQVTMVSYSKSHLFVDGYHSFSWQEPGKVIQTFFGAGYTFKLDSSNRHRFYVKNDFAFNRVANNGSFVRPMLIYRYQIDTRSKLTAVGWLFRDMRKDYTGQHLNGGIMYGSYTFSLTFKTWVLQNDTRLLYAAIVDVRDVLGVINQIKLSKKEKPYFLLTNIGYSFYRSDNMREFIWNVSVGLHF